MSEELKPGAETAPDVLEGSVPAQAEAVVEAEPEAQDEVRSDIPAEEGATESVAEDAAAGDAVAESAADVSAAEPEMPDYSEMSLAELSHRFEELSGSEDRMQKSKEAEIIKAAFYKRLSREKIAAGLVAPASDAEVAADGQPDAASGTASEETSAETFGEKTPGLNPFAALENGFKAIYAKYKKERAEFNSRIEKEREENLKLKQAVIEELKALVDGQEDVGSAFPAFRELQARWRAVGQVPVQSFRNLNDTYQFYVEKFYDKVQINRDLRDLDFKKNLEAKEGFCQQAEKLSENENVVDAFKELQKLHEQWKEFGPVAKEYRDQIWDRFKAATAVINKKYQTYFEEQKSRQAENLVAKTALCERVEAIADKEDIKSSNEWNALTKDIEAIQKEWKTIGFASKKENQKIYDRFRAACDKFFARKREFYVRFKDGMSANMEKKLAIIVEAEALKCSTEWKKTTDKFINLQNQWKEIGAVPRKKSEQLWKRFRAACDEFFAERDKQISPENNYGANLKAKKAVIDEINAYEPSSREADAEAAAKFAARWQEIGFVPFKEKDKINKAYSEAFKSKFGDAPVRGSQSRRPQPEKSEKERLVQKYHALQQDIDTYENNIGFFARGKNSQPLIQQMQERIEAAKRQLAELEGRIREMESSGEQN